MAGSFTLRAIFHKMTEQALSGPARQKRQPGKAISRQVAVERLKVSALYSHGIGECSTTSAILKKGIYVVYCTRSPV